MKSVLMVTIETDEKRELDAYTDITESAIHDCLCSRHWLRSYKVERVPSEEIKESAE